MKGANYGRCPFKKETYFGFKVHVLITLEGYISVFEIIPASVDDSKGFRDFAENHLNLVILGVKDAREKLWLKQRDLLNDSKAIQL